MTLAFFRFSSLGLLAWTLVGCGVAPELEAAGVATQGIQGGYEAPDDTGVVGIVNIENDGLCAGAVIAPNVVLTGRHCVTEIVFDEENENPACPGDAAIGGKVFGTASIWITPEPEFKPEQKYYRPVKKIVPAPTDSDWLCGTDVAILILQNNLTPEEAKLMVPRVDVALEPGEQYSAVGYGATKGTGGGEGTRRRRDGLVVDCVGEGCKGSGQYMTPSEWIGETGACPGDSGSPTFDAKGRVTGVMSRGGNACDAPIHGAVSAWAKWIQDTTVSAAELGGYPPPAWALGSPTDPEFDAPVGAACEQPDQCPTNRCFDDGTAKYCTRACSDAMPCPEGYACDAAQSICAQQHEEPAPATPPKETAGADEESGGCAVKPARAGGGDAERWVAGAIAGLMFAACRRRRSTARRR